MLMKGSYHSMLADKVLPDGLRSKRMIDLFRQGYLELLGRFYTFMR